MKTKQDPEFGTLTEALSGWALEQRVLLGGQEVPVVLQPDDEGNFDPMQRQAARLALALGPDALEEAAPAVVQNYEVYRYMIGDPEQAPQLERLVDVWQQVQIESIDVPPHPEAKHAYFLIRAECDWSPGHGLAVRFRNGVAIESNQIGDCDGAWDDTPEELEEMRQPIVDAASTALKKPGQQA